MMKKDWEIKKLGDVCLKRDSIKWKNENSNTEYQYIDLSAVDRESKGITDTQIITKENAPSRAQQLVKTGDILFGTTRPTLKRFCLLSDDYDGQICSTGFCVVRPNQRIVSPDWIFYQFYNEEFYEYIEPLQKGANYPAVTDKDIYNFNIPVPPLEEQKRIVKIMDEKFAQLESLKANAQSNLQNAKDLFQSQLKKIFNNKDLKKKKLSDLCELISGYAFDSKGYTSNDEDTLLICGDNIMHCSFRWETVKKWPKEQYNDLKRFELKEYDIVLAMDRPWIKSGLKISKITENELPSLLVQRTAAIRTTRKILSEYLYYALQEESFSKYLVDQQTGAGVPHISGKQILNFEVGIPLSPSTRSEDLELRGIVKELDTLSEKVKALCAIYEKQIADCDELKQAYLQKAFAGEL